MQRWARVDRDLARYLVPGERVVTAVRQHWLSQARAASIAIGATVLALWIDVRASSQSGRVLADLGWLLWLASLLYLAWRVMNWRRDWFVATDKRLLLFYGFIRRKVAMMPLSKVTDMTFDRSLMGRVMGYGTFILESAGQDQALSNIEYVPDADEHYRAICSELFGSEEWESDEEWGDGRGPGSGGSGPPGPPDPYAGGPGSAPDGGAGWVEVDEPSQRPESTEPDGESIYRSPDLRERDRLEDTGEIPVVASRPSRGGRDDPQGRPR